MMFTESAKQRRTAPIWSAMGAGEPFLNFENLIKALEIMAEEDGLFIVPNRVTVSTAGIVPKIYEFAKLEKRPHLAISLSAPTDELRDKLMPINRRWNIEELFRRRKKCKKPCGAASVSRLNTFCSAA